LNGIVTRVCSFAGLLLACAWWLSVGGGCNSPAPSVPGPQAGTPDFQEIGLIAVPGAQLQVAGGNLVVARTDLVIDTRLGPLEVGQTWNAATKTWHSTFSPSYLSGSFTDPTGATFAIGSQTNSTAIPGTTWVKLGTQLLRTKGGLLHAFDGSGRLTTVRWASSDYPRLSYIWQTIAGAQRLARIDQCTTASSCGAVYSLSYDTAGRLSSIVDRAGRSALYSYDGAGRLASARDGLDVAKAWLGFRYEYDGTGRLVALTNSENERSEYGYDGSGRLTLARAIGPGSPTYTFAYAATAGVFETTATDPTSRVARYRWNSGRSITRIQNGAGEITSYEWSGKRPIRRTDPDGTVTTWTWLDDDIATETQPSGNVFTFSYAPNAVDRERPQRRPLAALSDSLGLREQRSYDASGRLIAVTNGAGETTQLGYASDQSLSSVVFPSGQATSFLDYGEHGHPERVVSTGQVDQRVYDAVGNLLSGAVPAQPAGPGNPGVVSRGFDADRNLASLTVAGLDLAGTAPQGTITITSRSDHRRTAITRPYGDDSQFVYDALGRFVERRDKADATFRSTLIAHDAAGRRISRTRPNGMRELVGYDAAGRVQSLAHARGATVETSTQLAYAAGHLASQTDAGYGAPESYTWDAAGRLERVVFAGGESSEVDYDLRGRVINETLRLPGGSILLVLAYEYDGADRLVAIREGPKTHLARTYEDGLLEQESYGNGLVREYTWDADGRLVGAVLRNPQGVEVETTIIDRSLFPVGNVPGVPNCITAWTTTSVGVALTTGEAYATFTQAASGGRRLAKDVEDPWTQLPGTYADYAYDELGNLVRVTDGLSTLELVYNTERNRLLAVEDETGTLVDYTWDEAGFATSRGGMPLAWNAQGRIATMGGFASFGWDAVGRPRQATVLGAARHFRFGGRVYGPAPGVFATADYGSFTLDLMGGEDRYRHFDFRRNVKLVTDEMGAVVTHYRYAGYGIDEVHGEPGDGTSFVRGRELGGLLLLGMRVLDPLAGRFLSPDPIYQVANQFAYADANPVEFWDPAGTVSISATVGGNAGLDFGIVSFGGDYSITISGDGADGAKGDGGGGGGSGEGSSGEGSSGGGGGGGGVNIDVNVTVGDVDVQFGCSPGASIRSTPHARLALAVLLPPQLALGALLLLRRRTGK
jgi:RHS repeat-associated protein